jgi:hypothetical protein
MRMVGFIFDLSRDDHSEVNDCSVRIDFRQLLRDRY